MWLLQWIHETKHSSKNKPKHQTTYMSKRQRGIHHFSRANATTVLVIYYGLFLVNHCLEVFVAVYKMAPNLLSTTGKTTKRALQSLNLASQQHQAMFTPSPVWMIGKGCYGPVHQLPQPLTGKIWD